MIHTGDFKIDQTPLDGELFDFHRFAESVPPACWRCCPTARTSIGAGSPGRSVEVIDGFEEIFTSAQGKIIVAMFSSSIFRMQILVDLAAQFERQVAFIGRGMNNNSEIASGSATCGFRPAS